MARLAGGALLVAIAVLSGTPLAYAGPPAPGTTHTFFDPVFRGTVVCDTLEEVRRIVTAEVPDEVYANFAMTTNDADEPMCMAITPTATVLEISPLGVMVRNGGHYNAWAIKTDIGGTTAYALYLERFEFVAA